MIFRINRALRQLRRRKGLGISLLLLVLVGTIVGNALTFYFFDRSTKPELSVADAFWYSIISIATIGYGDLSSTSLGARIGTAFFIVFVVFTVIPPFVKTFAAVFIVRTIPSRVADCALVNAADNEPARDNGAV